MQRHASSQASWIHAPNIDDLDYSAVVVECYTLEGTNHQDGILEFRFLLLFKGEDGGGAAQMASCPSVSVSLSVK